MTNNLAELTEYKTIELTESSLQALLKKIINEKLRATFSTNVTAPADSYFVCVKEYDSEKAYQLSLSDLRQETNEPLSFSTFIGSAEGYGPFSQLPLYEEELEEYEAKLGLFWSETHFSMAIKEKDLASYIAFYLLSESAEIELKYEHESNITGESLHFIEATYRDPKSMISVHQDLILL